MDATHAAAVGREKGERGGGEHCSTTPRTGRRAARGHSTHKTHVQLPETFRQETPTPPPAAPLQQRPLALLACEARGGVGAGCKRPNRPQGEEALSAARIWLSQLHKQNGRTCKHGMLFCFVLSSYGVFCMHARPQSSNNTNTTQHYTAGSEPGRLGRQARQADGAPQPSRRSSWC